MSGKWPLVALKSVVAHQKRFIEVDDTVRYMRCRVQLHARGIVLRDIVTGSEIKTKRQQVCQAGELLVAEIDAKVGGFGIVPVELDGAIVSSHYFLFAVDDTQLDREYLGYCVRTRQFFAQVAAKGSTNYAAIRPYDVLGYVLPLPSLNEQKNIVSKLVRFQKKMEQARQLQEHVRGNVRKLLLSAFNKIVADAPRCSMLEVAPLQRRPVAVDPEGQYRELGIRSFGKGTFHKPTLTGLEIGTKRIFSIEPGDLLFGIVFAWEGAVAVARPEDSGRVGSHRFLTCVVNPEMATAQFLRFHFSTKEGLEQLGHASPGGAGRNRTLGLSALNKIMVPVPTLEQQQWFDRLQAKVAAVSELGASTDEKFSLLMASVLDRAIQGIL